MKVYLFNTENGLFEGEAYQEAEALEYEEGITTIPPPDYGPGQVPVFDQRCQTWAVMPIAVARQLFVLRLIDSKECH